MKRPKRLTYGQQVSELFQAGWRLADIAGLTPWSRHALFMPRNQHGQLILDGADEELPEHVKVDSSGRRVIAGKRVSLQQAFRKINQERGLTEQQINEAWAKYVGENPMMVGSGKGKKKERPPTGKVTSVPEGGAMSRRRPRSNTPTKVVRE